MIRCSIRSRPWRWSGAFPSSSTFGSTAADVGEDEDDIGGGGDWLHSLRAVRDVSNVYVDLSGSGVDGGMLEACVESAGVSRLLWGSDITMDTGWAKLRYLETLLAKDEIAAIRWKNAARIFPPRAFPSD